MTDTITLAFDVDERRNGWHFRYPAEDESAIWRGPYTSRALAEAAALVEIENYLSQHVASALGL